MKHLSKYAVMVSIIVAAMFSGCKTKQKAVLPPAANPKITAEEMVNHAIDAQPTFKTMNISKMTMLINYGQYSFTFRGSLRVATDSLVSISIQPALGIEMFRIEFQPSGFAVYDKMNRRYSQNSYNYLFLKTGINIDYKAVEALFSHQIFTPQSVDRKVLAEAFDIRQIGDTSTIISKQSIASFAQRFDISSVYRLTMTGLDKDSVAVLAITYGNLSRFDGVDFPETVSLKTAMPELPIDATLYIEKVIFDDPIVTTPINLSRYTKSSLTEVISFKK